MFRLDDRDNQVWVRLLKVSKTLPPELTFGGAELRVGEKMARFCEREAQEPRLSN